ncbi:MAG: transcriptional repressor [Oscillospiraceae bacterium]|nr:transcriptional repressor [Oscillospiraceae bacterium]
MNNKRNTLQRQLILNAVQELNIHATAEQVFAHVAKQHPAISKATVYRNLSQMAQSGMLLDIGNFAGAAHYDHNLHNHYHFMCESCRRIFDVEADFSDMYDRLGNIDGFDVVSHNLSFNGTCRKCKSQVLLQT